MAVPDTDTFAMSDVVTEIGSGDDLVELFSLATGTFDPAYVGDKTNLLNFRNYANVGIVLDEPFDSIGDWAISSASVAFGALTLNASGGSASNSNYGVIVDIGTNIRITYYPDNNLAVGDFTNCNYNGVNDLWSDPNSVGNFIVEGVTTNQNGFDLSNTKFDERKIGRITVETI